MSKRDVEIYFLTKVKDVLGQRNTVLGIQRMKERFSEENMFVASIFKTWSFKL